VVDAAEGWNRHLDEGGQDAGDAGRRDEHRRAGISLAEMIRQDKVHAISCTGANLEEDIFNLVAHDHYERVPNWRALTAEDEHASCSPPHEPRHRHLHPRGRGDAAHREAVVLEEWVAADRAGERYFPHEFMYKILRGGKLEGSLPDRPEELLDAGRRREEPADLRARLGGLHARQHVHRPRDRRAT
jgi:deoxyhypusine synthase